MGDSPAAPGSPRFWMAAGLFVAALLAPVVVAVVRRRIGQPPSFERA